MPRQLAAEAALLKVNAGLPAPPAEGVPITMRPLITEHNMGEEEARKNNHSLYIRKMKDIYKGAKGHTRWPIPEAPFDVVQ